jgi:hypothetical protein
MFLPSLTREVPPSRGQNLGPHAYVCRERACRRPWSISNRAGSLRTLDRYREELPFLLAGAECDGGSTSLGFATWAS